MRLACSETGEARGGFPTEVTSGFLQQGKKPHHQNSAVRPQSLPSTRPTAISQEVSILSKLAHNNVVRFIGACTSRPNLCIVCELMPGGSVSDLLRRVRKRVMP